jgi:hypothetical protein
MFEQNFRFLILIRQEPAGLFPEEPLYNQTFLQTKRKQGDECAAGTAQRGPGQSPGLFGGKNGLSQWQLFVLSLQDNREEAHAENTGLLAPC